MKDAAPFAKTVLNHEKADAHTERERIDSAYLDLRDDYARLLDRLSNVETAKRSNKA